MEEIPGLGRSFGNKENILILMRVAEIVSAS